MVRRWKERESRPAHSEDGGLKVGATRRLPISNAFLLTTFGEEGLEDGGGFGGEDAGGDFHLVIEAGMGEDFETGTDCAAGGVVVANGAVAGAGEDFAAVRENGADGHFAGDGRRTRFFESSLHELDVGFHLRREDTMREERCKEPRKQVKQGGKEPKSKTVA